MALDPYPEAAFTTHEISWGKSARANGVLPPFDARGSDTEQRCAFDEVQHVACERRLGSG